MNDSRSQTGTQYVSTDEMRNWREQIATVKTELARKSQSMANNLSNTYEIIRRRCSRQRSRTPCRRSCPPRFGSVAACRRKA